MARRAYPVVKLEDLGSVLTLHDLAALMQVAVSTMQKLGTLERKTGIKCLPVEVPGFKHRYTKEAVQRWLRTGAPQFRRRS